MKKALTKTFLVIAVFGLPALSATADSSKSQRTNKTKSVDNAENRVTEKESLRERLMKIEAHERFNIDMIMPGDYR